MPHQSCFSHCVLRNLALSLLYSSHLTFIQHLICMSHLYLIASRHHPFRKLNNIPVSDPHYMSRQVLIHNANLTIFPRVRPNAVALDSPGSEALVVAVIAGEVAVLPVAAEDMIAGVAGVSVAAHGGSAKLEGY